MICVECTQLHGGRWWLSGTVCKTQSAALLLLLPACPPTPVQPMPCCPQAGKKPITGNSSSTLFRNSITQYSHHPGHGSAQRAWMVRLAAQLSPPVTGTGRARSTSWLARGCYPLSRCSKPRFSTASALACSCSRRSTRARHLLLHVPVFLPPLRDGCKRAAPHLSSLASLAALPRALCGLVHPSASHHTPPLANFLIVSDWWLQAPCVPTRL